MRHRSPRKAIVGLLIAVLAGGTLSAIAAPAAQAADPSGFDPGYIISDAKFFDGNAMNEAQVQAFLNARVPACVGANGNPCVRDALIDTFSRPSAGAGHCGPYAGAAREPAARVIVKVALACRINPQVLLVTLQKEQGLITAVSPTNYQYRSAMGYGCPDTAPCDSAYYGFYNQMYWAAWQFRQYTNFPDRRYRIGAVSVQFHPNSACGATTVNIRNQATANLYNYTPYQPNSAALANLYGTGDSCSSYGNRNFWRFFRDWFGSPTVGDSPFGNLEVLAGTLGGIRVSGWAIDPNTTAPIDMHVYVDGVATRVPASKSRPDVGALHPSAGPNHGFDTTIPALGGARDVCVFGYNVGLGGNTAFGCARVMVQSGPPVGNLEAVAPQPGVIDIGGWALDPDSAASIAVHVYIDGVGRAFTANRDRPDIARLYPVFGAKHGFSERIAVPAGQRNVCVYAINVASGGTNPQLGCRTVNVPPPPAPVESGRAPFGSLEAVTPTQGAIDLAGWAIDPDTADSIDVHVYIDGAGAVYRANRERADVARVHPAYGALHGFSERIAASPGPHEVCAYAINTAAGGNALLGCRSVTVPAPPSESGRSPVGNFESAKAVAGGIEVAGWALDPDTTAPIAVHIYVDGIGTARLADKTRADVARIYPAYGAAHGFVEVVPAAAGGRSLCVYAINTAGEPHKLLGCRSVIVP